MNLTYLGFFDLVIVYLLAIYQPSLNTIPGMVVVLDLVTTSCIVHCVMGTVCLVSVLSIAFSIQASNSETICFY